MLSTIYCFGAFAFLTKLSKTGFFGIAPVWWCYASSWVQSNHFFSFLLRVFFPLVNSDTLHYLVHFALSSTLYTFFNLWKDLVLYYRQTNFRRLHWSYFGDNLRSIIYTTFRATRILKDLSTFSSKYHVNRTRFYLSKPLGSSVLCIWPFLVNIYISTQQFSYFYGNAAFATFLIFDIKVLYKVI